MTCIYPDLIADGRGSFYDDELVYSPRPSVLVTESGNFWYFWGQTAGVNYYRYGNFLQAYSTSDLQSAFWDTPATGYSPYASVTGNFAINGDIGPDDSMFVVVGQSSPPFGPAVYELDTSMGVTTVVSDLPAALTNATGYLAWDQRNELWYLTSQTSLWSVDPTWTTWTNLTDDDADWYGDGALTEVWVTADGSVWVTNSGSELMLYTGDTTPAFYSNGYNAGRINFHPTTGLVDTVNDLQLLPSYTGSPRVVDTTSYTCDAYHHTSNLGGIVYSRSVANDGIGDYAQIHSTLASSGLLLNRLALA